MELYRAIERGDQNRVKSLLNGTNVNGFDPHEGLTPLVHAVHASNAEIIQLLLANGASINATVNNQTALHFAVRSDQQHIVELMLTHGANINALGQDGTPLAMAANPSDHYSHFQGGMTMMLLEKGATIDSIALEDMVCGACSTGSQELLTYLLTNERYCNVESQGMYQTSPLHEAASSGHVHIVNYLLDQGITPIYINPNLTLIPILLHQACLQSTRTLT